MFKMKADGAARTVAKSLLSGELKGLKTTRDLELDEANEAGHLHSD